MVRRFRPMVVVASGLLAVALVATGCGGGDDGGGGAADPQVNDRASTAIGFKIGLLLPESTTARYETFDHPFIESRLSQLCAKCQVLYQNAEQDAAKQRSQAEAMLAEGAKVLILDPVDVVAAGEIVNNAKARNVPVVAYDRLAQGPVTYHVSFDNHKIGQLQGQALLDRLSKGGDPKRGQIVMINGSPGDPNAAEYKAGAHSVLAGKVNIGKEFDTPNWSPDQARREMEQAVTALKRDKIIGVYAANDTLAGGAIVGMQENGFLSPLPPVTGQDAELTGVQRIVSGDQLMTVFKSIRPEAETAAAMAIAAATGNIFSAEPTTPRFNGTQDVPSVLLTAVAVDKTNIRDTVIKENFYAPAQICAGSFAQRCAMAGIF